MTAKRLGLSMLLVLLAGCSPRPGLGSPSQRTPGIELSLPTIANLSSGDASGSPNSSTIPSAEVSPTERPPLDTSTIIAPTKVIELPAETTVPTEAIVTPVVEVPVPSSMASSVSQFPQGKIVYVCQVFRDGDRDQICLMNADGSGQRRMSQNDRGDYNYPSFTPDGQFILYAGKEGANFNLYQMDLAGSVSQLTFGAESEYAPHVSPDGTRLVYASRASSGQSIWVADRDGSQPLMVFGPPQGNGWDPVWSPDGERILFASDRSGVAQLFLVNPDGSGLRQVTNLQRLRGRSDWSPDGRTLATYTGPSWQRELILLDLQGTILQQLTQGGNNLAPSFSPDGGWITFTSYRDRYRDDDGCEIYIMRVDGNDIRRLTDNDYCDWQPRWGR